MNFKPTFDAAKTDDREKADKIYHIVISLFLALLLGIIAAPIFLSMLRAETLMGAVDRFLIIALFICFFIWRSSIGRNLLAILGSPFTLIIFVVAFILRISLAQGIKAMTFAEFGIDQSFFKGALIGALALIAVFMEFFRRKRTVPKNMSVESPRANFKQGRNFLKKLREAKLARVPHAPMGLTLIMAFALPRLLSAQALQEALYSLLIIIFWIGYCLSGKKGLAVCAYALILVGFLLAGVESLSLLIPAPGANYRVLTNILLFLFIVQYFFLALNLNQRKKSKAQRSAPESGQLDE